MSPLFTFAPPPHPPDWTRPELQSLRPRGSGPSTGMNKCDDQCFPLARWHGPRTATRLGAAACQPISALLQRPPPPGSCLRLLPPTPPIYSRPPSMTWRSSSGRLLLSPPLITQSARVLPRPTSLKPDRLTPPTDRSIDPPLPNSSSLSQFLLQPSFSFQQHHNYGLIFLKNSKLLVFWQITSSQL